MGTMTVTVGR